VAAELPTGTVTFLFTDLESSTRLWEEQPAAMRAALARHDEILRRAVERHGGYVVKTTGDGVHAAFATARDALDAAAAGQVDLAEANWGTTAPLRVRMGVHTGEAQLREGDYYGAALNRAARLTAVAHGGQVVCSQATTDLVRDALPEGTALVDLGEHRLRDLSRPERVFQLTAPGLRDAFPRLQSVDVSQTNLPVQVTSFVGRAEEVHSIEELLERHRIVTLAGIGGVGKTRLASQVAGQLLDHYRDGVWLVELATVEPPRLVAVMAAALGVDMRAGGTTLEAALLEHLTSREALLILDNAEHLIREARRVAELILHETTGVSLLVTSREGLRVTGEQLFSVPSLEDDAAIRLFGERAAGFVSGFELKDRDVDAVAALCDRLDGIPLAIELAAARVSMFSIDDLTKRVSQRFRLLTGGRGVIERHQTLRAAIDWSYDLLTAEERLALARASVFAGGCTLEAAEAVLADGDVGAEDVLDLVSGLIDKSLLIVDRTRSETRYDMLETVRQYAEDRLVDSGEAEAVRTRHARWYAGFARSAGRGLYSSDEAAWLERLGSEMNNLQVAVRWSVASDDTDSAMRLGGSFPRQGMARPLLGTIDLADQALTVRGADVHPLRARVMAEAAWAAVIRGDDAKAKSLLEQAIDAQYHGARYTASAFVYLHTLLGWSGTVGGDSANIGEQGLAMAEAVGDVLGATGLRIALAVDAVINERGDAVAYELAQAALVKARELNQPTLECAALYANGVVRARTDPQLAMSLLAESIDLARLLDIDNERQAALGMLAALEGEHGDARRSLEAIREALSGRTVAPRFDLVYVQHAVSVFNRMGRPDLVALSHGCLRAVRGGDYRTLYGVIWEENLAKARGELGSETYERLAAEGSAIPSKAFIEMMIREIDDLLHDMPQPQ
jgi:predicted ATPase/class 3 adenylate cyclase